MICLDLGGPAVQITKETGFKIAAKDPDQSVRDIAAVMQQLAQNPELCHQMGQAGRQLVDNTFSWTAVGQQLNTLYETTSKTIPVTA